jgi:nucleotide-binding universal stress UspA family protein
LHADRHQLAVTVYGTVVVGHDGTAAADAALRLAEQLADERARLLLARIVAKRPDEAEAELAALRARVDPPLRVETRVIAGHSADRGLAVLAREEDADLIVVGSDRRPEDYRGHKVLGLRLLRGAPCAVAIAAADGEAEIRRIGVAYDGSAEAELALEAAYAIAQRMNAAITLYLAVLPEYTEDLRAQLAHREAGALLDAAADRAPAGVNPETVVVTGYASLALAERAAGVVDLLVVGSRRQGPIRQALLGSTSRALAVELDCAVLVTPRSARLRVAVT